jgi:tetratricopeptide (TPR) repeat protein
MKIRIFLLTAVFAGTFGFAQKNEIKAAEKALKEGNSAEAKSVLDAAKSLFDAADDRTQAQYYYLLGKTYADMAEKGDNAAFEPAAEAFKKSTALEEASGKAKYTSENEQWLRKLSADLVNSAVDDNGKELYESAAEKLYLSYKLSPADTIYLYYAASSAVNGGHYEKAIGYYNELKEIGYDGSSIAYKATNVETGEVEEMNQVQRDLMVKSGSYTNPVDEKQPSRNAEIVKNIALIYTQIGKNDEALAAYVDARASNPDDVNLLLNEANLHYQLGDKEKFKSLMAEAAEMQPDNADLHYNIGVINMEQGYIEEARAAYMQAIEVDPGYINAQLNLSTTYVNEGNALIDTMNNLGSSRADIAKYDELKAKKDALFMQGANILEKALKVTPDSEGILTQLKNIYAALGNTEEFIRIKKLLGE